MPDDVGPAAANPAAGTSAPSPLTGEVLTLFTSNLRPQYEQDALDLSAAVPGTHYRFRYRERWVAEKLRAPWRSDELVGKRAVAIFSIQQLAAFHPAAFVPLREATIIRTSVDGEGYVCEFSVGDYLALKVSPGSVDSDRTVQGQAVRSFTDALARSVDGYPDGDPAMWASLCRESTIAPLLDAGFDQSRAFQRLVRVLSNTASFRDAVFLRAASISPLGGAAISPVEGRFDLTSGLQYELTLAQYQATEINQSVDFQIKVDGESVRIIGSEAFRIASAVDVGAIGLFLKTQTEATDSQVVVVPPVGVRGPTVTLRIRSTVPVVQQALVAGFTGFGVLLAGIGAAVTKVTLAGGLVLLIGGATCAGSSKYVERWRWLRRFT